MEQRIFISYARADGEDFAHDLRDRLTDVVGVEALWRNRDRMEGGRDWWNQIVEALKTVKFMVLVATPAAMASAIVRKLKKHFYPIALLLLAATYREQLLELAKWIN